MERVMAEPEESYVEQTIRRVLGDNEGRFVLVGSKEDAEAGRAMIYDTKDGGWIRITSADGRDERHRDVALQMWAAGARLLSEAPEAPQ